MPGTTPNYGYDFPTGGTDLLNSYDTTVQSGLTKVDADMLSVAGSWRTLVRRAAYHAGDSGFVVPGAYNALQTAESIADAFQLRAADLVGGRTPKLRFVVAAITNAVTPLNDYSITLAEIGTWTFGTSGNVPAPNGLTTLDTSALAVTGQGASAVGTYTGAQFSFPSGTRNCLLRIDTPASSAGQRVAFLIELQHRLV